MGFKKFCHTLRILFCLGMARTFGRYEYSGWNGEIDYAQYQWRGRSWLIPTSCITPIPD
jgi:hypothetical protein